MRRTTIALLAALEASVSALVGYGIALVPLMLLWATHFGLAAPIDAFFRAAADMWLLGHGVDLAVRLDELTAALLGVPGAGDPFVLTIALLGFAVVTFAFGLRIGRRGAIGGNPAVAVVAAVVVLAAVGGVVAAVAATGAARPVLWQGIVLPASVMAVGAAIGAVAESLRSGAPADATTSAVRRRLAALPDLAVDGVAAAVRIGVGAAFGVLAVGAVLVAVVVVAGYSTIVGLYQALGAGIDGGIAITVAELALLPNLVVWAAAWLLGPGFALGAGTTVSPSVTLMGPVPGIPVLGALPAEGAPLGVLWLALPVLLGFGGAVLVAASAPERRDEPWWATLAVGLGAGGIAGLVLGGLAAFSGGAAGPGRLAVVGPDAFLVAAAAAASVGVGAVAGAFAARSRVRHGDVSAPGDPRAMRDDGLGDRDRRDAAPADRDGSDTEVLDDARLPR
ncbi:DUF6350 family protein [Agromyces tardus]